MEKGKVVVISKTGLHARPANTLIKHAQRYKSAVEIAINGKNYNAKSMLGILAAGINCGVEIEVICNGEDEKVACKEMIQLIASGLEE